MRVRRCFSLMVLLLLTGSVDAGTIEALVWMSGSWAGTKDGVHSEEHWSTPKGGMLIGMHRDVKDGRAVGFEFFRIQMQDGVITYLTQPGGKPATPFAAKELGPKRVVFENAAHDFPQRIIYWQTKPNELRARIEGTIDGNLESEEWAWTSSSLSP